MKTQIGLGVLSIPSAFDILGMVPGVICLCVVAVITTWSGYIIGNFKIRHPEVYSINDVGELLFGQFGRWFLAAVFCLCMAPHPGANKCVSLTFAHTGYSSAVPPFWVYQSV